MHLTGGVTRGASSVMPLPASITVSTWVPVVPSTVELTVGTREAGLLIMLEKGVRPEKIKEIASSHQEHARSKHNKRNEHQKCRFCYHNEQD